MRLIDPNSKVLSLTHSDMDGVGCQIVLGHVFKHLTCQASTFVSVNKLFNDKNFEGYDHIFITDIYPNYPELLTKYEDRIVLLDHHNTSLGNHNPFKMRFVDSGQCATSLTKKFVEQYFHKDLGFLDKFVYHVNDYDL